MEPGGQETITTGTITRITRDWVTQDLVVSLNKDRSASQIMEYSLLSKACAAYIATLLKGITKEE